LIWTRFSVQRLKPGTDNVNRIDRRPIPKTGNRQPRTFLSWARALLLFWPIIFFVTVIVEPFCLLAVLLDRSGRAQHALVRWWARILLKLLAPVTVEGLERIDPARPRLYAANHLSALDIPLLYAYLPFTFRIMAHRLVFRVPLIGWYLRRAGALEISPDSIALSRRALREAVKTLRRGMPLVIFPEGERSPTGKMLPFRRGAFHVAIKAQVEVVPIAILGAYEALPVGSAHLRRVPLRLVIGKPIDVAGSTRKDLQALAERVQTAVRELYEAAEQQSDCRD
jgi:1-acyl-sn-glycerol-3-phosphate acyltransferase